MHVPTIGDVLIGVMGRNFIVTIRVVRTVAMIACSRHQCAGAIAEEPAPDSEKLRSHHSQNAKGEHKLVE